MCTRQHHTPIEITHYGIFRNNIIVFEIDYTGEIDDEFWSIIYNIEEPGNTYTYQLKKMVNNEWVEVNVRLMGG